MSLESKIDMPHSWTKLPATPLGSGALGQVFADHGCGHFQEAARFIQELPYGRTSSPSPTAVLAEGRGTCSSKHRLIAMLADELGIEAPLVLACFEMSEDNTPGVGRVLSRQGLESMLEAHCFLRFKGQVVDLTWPGSGLAAQSEFFHEQTVAPMELPNVKTSYHRANLQDWARNRGLPHSVDDLWSIREQCIAALQGAV